jgi:hypothetical protein
MTVSQGRNPEALRERTNKTNVPRFIQRLFPRVEEVVDADTPVSVHVTEDDCDSRAQKMNPNECAMARALKRQFKANGAIIGLSKSYLIRGKRALRFTTPATVGREITSFDRHHDFAPGDYKLAAVSRSQRMGASYSRREGRHGPHDQPRIVHKRTVRVRLIGSKGEVGE